MIGFRNPNRLVLMINEHFSQVQIKLMCVQYACVYVCVQCVFMFVFMCVCAREISISSSRNYCSLGDLHTLILLY